MVEGDSATDQIRREANERIAARKARQETAPQPPTVRSLCLEQTLYAPIQLNPDRDSDYISNLKTEGLQFDAHCVHCGRLSTFRTLDRETKDPVAEALKASAMTQKALEATKRLKLQGGQFVLHVNCSRQPLHLYSFFFHYAEMEAVLTKIGQAPSIEDVAGSDIERYRKILGANFSELRRATGLYAHGIGIGAFVYLRRIFERLIEDARKAVGVDPDDFNQKRMIERVETLSGTLPPAVVRYKAAYGILSKGVHELTEDECRRYFPAIRASIIMMLEERYEAEQKKKAADDLEREFRSIENSLKS